MMKNDKGLKTLFMILCCTTYQLQAVLTTLQHSDPSPIYSAMNDRPINNHCLEIHTYNEFNDPEKKVPVCTFTVMPTYQRAIRGQNDKGTLFGVVTVDTTPTAGNNLGDMLGLPFVLGLYLGADENGNRITGNVNTDDVKNNANNITDTNVNLTKLPQALKDTLVKRNLNSSSSGSLFGSILYDSSTLSDGSTSGIPQYYTTLLSEETLYRVTPEHTISGQEYIGCFSVPTEYSKAGLRFECAINLSKSFDLVLQAGAVQVEQKLKQPLINLTNTTNSAIYSAMWEYVNPTGTLTTQQAKAKDSYNDQITNNLDDLLSIDRGIGFEYKDYSSFQAEDVRFCLSWKHPLVKNIEDEDVEDDYQMLVFTPYGHIAGSAPAGSEKVYKNALEMSAGNNGHFSIGGTVGITCDFIETIQVGLEGGYDHFFSKVHENMPCPNSKYQSVLYPYKRNIIIQPGANIHFAAHLNAYQFMTNANFCCSYEFISHAQDKHTLVADNKNFLPKQLDKNTQWTSQMFRAGINVDVTKEFNFGIAVQFPLAQRNAFNSASVGASLSFMF